MLPDGCKILTCFTCIDENFFVPMRDARGYRTRQALKTFIRSYWFKGILR